MCIMYIVQVSLESFYELRNVLQYIDTWITVESAGSIRISFLFFFLVKTSLHGYSVLKKITVEGKY